MDRRSKHLSSDVRGVIFAEHNRGDKKTAPIARKRHGLSMMSVARDADASAS